MAAKFKLPFVQDNPTGWGPNSMPDKFKDMPYQPFSKGDRLGKISDWTGNFYQDRMNMNRYNSAIGAGGTQYAYYHEEDESSFRLVDTSRPTRFMYGRGRFTRGGAGAGGRGGRGGGFNGRGGSGGGLQRWNMSGNKAVGSMQVLSKGQNDRDRQKNSRKMQMSHRGRGYNRSVQLKQRESSVTVRPDWIVIEEMEKAQLAKLALPTVSDPEDLSCCGTMEYYDKTYDRVNVKYERPLKRIDRIFHTVTTTDDPVIRQLVRTQTDVNVFATDAILSTLMCCTRSVYSWDIVVQKIQGKIFLDKRDNTEFDLLTVSETAAEPPQDEGNSLNSPRNLALEATFINHNYSQQVLKSEKEKFSFPNENPFKEDESGSNGEDEAEANEAEANSNKTKVASVGYRYRKWDLGNDVKLVARCEHDAVTQGPHDETLFLSIKALNEWDSKFSGNVDWRQKLDVQPGAVLANELKHNACKLAKWTVQAILAGTDIIKFGYISRIMVKDSTKHVILGSQQFKPSEFADQINLSMDNAWGIVRCIIDLVMQQKDGKYLIVKDPNKYVVRLYDIPDNTFDSDEDSEADGEGGAGAGDE